MRILSRARRYVQSAWSAIFPKHCEGCSAPISKANRSSAHIIPNALGGRLTSSWLICAKCNTELDEIADHALIEAFGVIPTLLDIPRQRGANPPKRLKMQSGANVVLSPDGSLKTTDMSYKVTPVTEGHSVEIEAPDRKRAGQLIKRAAKQFPQLNAEDAANAARVVTLPDDDAMRVSVNFGSQAVGGGAWTIVWLFYLLRIRRKLMPWVELHAVIKREQEHGTCFRFLADTPAGIIGPDPDMGHVLVLRLLPATGEVVAFIQILGVLKLAGVIGTAKASARGFQQIYAFDVLGGREVTDVYSIDASMFDAQDWRNMGASAVDAVDARTRVEKALETVKRVFEQRQPKKPI